jgi:phage/plasmid-associated DNA primase
MTTINNFENACFVKTINAPLNITTIKSLSYNDLKNINNYFEVIDGYNSVHPYIDLDGELPNYSMYEFQDINNEIIEILKTLNDVSIITSSKYYCKKINNNNEIKFVNKLSYRLTFYNEICDNIKECRNYIENVKYPLLKKKLKNVIDLTDTKTEDGLNIDYAVYRTKGKIRCVNAYKDTYDKERINILIKGNIEQTIISANINNMEIENIDDTLETKNEPLNKKLIIPKKTEKIILDNKDKVLNDLFSVNYKWEIIKESDNNYKLNHNSYNCIVNPNHNHTELIHSCLYLNEESLISCCHSHGKKIYDNETFENINKLLGLKIEINDDFLQDVKEQIIELDIKTKTKKKSKKITNKKIKKLEEQIELEKQKEKINLNDNDVSDDNIFFSILNKYLTNTKKYKNNDIKKIINLSFKICNHNTEKSLSDLYISLNRENLYVYDNIFYIFTNDKWLKSTLQNIEIIRFNINIVLNDYFSDIVNILNNITNDMDEDEEHYESLRKKCNKYYETTLIVNKTQWLNNILREVRCTLINEQINNSDVFDKQHHIFAFKNVLFNLNTNEKIDFDKKHYITINNKKDYIEPTQEEMDYIHEIFVSIFPDPEILNCYLSILRYGLSGIRLEKIIIANGNGRNGKGLLNEMMEYLLGTDYFYKAPIDLFTKEVNMIGANPQVASLHNKRFVLATEPADNKSLKMNTAKEITGCNSISARGLYQSESNVILLLTLVIECNKKPMMDGRMDSSIIERVLDIPFINTFTSDEEKIDNKHYFRANPKLKQDEFKKKHYSAFFKYIILNAPKNLYVPDIIKKRSKEYVMDNDEFYMWVDDKYILTNDNNDIIKTKDMYRKYKNGSYYKNLTKKAKRQNNYKNFNDMIKHHVIMKKLYTDDKKKINGTWINCSRLHGIKEKYEGDYSDMDSDMDSD